MKENFKNVVLTTETVGGLLDGLEYTGTLKKEDRQALFVQAIVGRGSGRHYRNKVVSDLGGGNKVFQLRDGLLKLQIFVMPKDFRAKKLGRIVRALIDNAEDVSL